MKKKIEIEITDGDIEYQIKEVIKDELIDDIRDIAKKQISEMVFNIVKDKVRECALNIIKEAEFVYSSEYYGGYNSEKGDLTSMFRQIIQDCLNSPSYIFNKNEKRPYHRYGYSKDGPSLIDLIVSDNVREIVNNEYKPYIDECIQKYVLDINKMSEIMGQQIEKFFSDKMKEIKI